MTVKEFIRVLRKFPPDALVVTTRHSDSVEAAAPIAEKGIKRQAGAYVEVLTTRRYGLLHKTPAQYKADWEAYEASMSAQDRALLVDVAYIEGEDG
jgi:hypothetical protein